jgi:homoaconitase/3-isopropylmalate dehydratase large subunit
MSECLCKNQEEFNAMIYNIGMKYILASPATVAASAIEGKIADSRRYFCL